MKASYSFERMHTCELLKGVCMLQYSGTINQFTASCSFQVFDCFCKPQKDSLGLLPFHFEAPMLRALLQIMIWTWVKVSETYWRSNQSSNIKTFQTTGPGSKIYFWNIHHEFKRLCGNSIPKITSKWRDSEVRGEDAYIGNSVFAQVCASRMRVSDQKGKGRIIKIINVLPVYTSVCKLITTSDTTHWPDLGLLKLEQLLYHK